MSNYWQDEGYNWEVDSSSFKLADNLVSHHAFTASSILDFGKDYKDERNQFDKVYQWVLNTVEWVREIHIIENEFHVNDAPDIYQVESVNQGSTLMKIIFHSEDGTTVTDSSELTFEQSLHLGTKAKAKVSIPFFASAEVEIDVDINVSFGEKYTHTVEKKVTYGIEYDFDIPPFTTNYFKFTILRAKSNGKVNVVATPHFTDYNPPTLNMNYGNVYVRMNELSENEKTFTATANFTGANSTSISVDRFDHQIENVPMSELSDFI
jgi:hypothetical protein